jgi:Tol biopolymer transport system component
MFVLRFSTFRRRALAVAVVALASAVTLLLVAAALAGTASAPAERRPATAGVPAAGAAGEAILFEARRGGSWEVLSIAPDGSRLRNLSRSRAQDTSPAWSPDGRKIAFVRIAHESPPDPTELWVMNADGSGQLQLEGVDSSIDWPRWSPDGSTVSFLDHTSFGSGDAVTGEYFELHAIDPAGGPVRRVAEGADASDDSWSWSPDSMRIAFQRERRGGSTLELAIVHLSTGRVRMLARGRDPAWSPNGRLIAYSMTWLSSTAGPSSRADGIYVIRPDGSGRRRLTHGRDWAPTWSPDGRRLAFARSAPDGGSHVYVVLAHGSQARRVSERLGDVNAPTVWSPDGTQLAWSVGYSSSPSLLIARADGSGSPRKLATGFVHGWRRTPNGHVLGLD